MTHCLNTTSTRKSGKDLELVMDANVEVENIIKRYSFPFRSFVLNFTHHLLTLQMKKGDTLSFNIDCM